MKINGKNYEITTAVPYGIMRSFNNDPNNPENIDRFLKNVLIPEPTEEELDEFLYDDILEIMAIFQKKLAEKQTEVKKKVF